MNLVANPIGAKRDGGWRGDLDGDTYAIDPENLGDGGNVGWRAGGEASIVLNTNGNIGVAHSLRADGFDASEDGTGLGVPLVPETCPAIKARDHKGPSSDGDGDGDGAILVPLAFDTTQITSAANHSNPKAGDPRHPLAAEAHVPAVAFHNRQDPDFSDGVTHPLGAKDNGLGLGLAVRRLTPRECERLQGFSDDYTAITYKGMPAADGPRYRALGNSMAVPCMRWIGERIAMAEACYKKRDEAR